MTEFYNPIIIKTSDNINRIVDSSKNTNSTDNIIQTNSNIGIPLVYGTQMYAPTLIYQEINVQLNNVYKTATFTGGTILRDTVIDTMAWIGVYAVTINQNLRNDNYSVQQVFINGETYTNTANYAPFQSYFSSPGFNANGKIITGLPGNVFGEKNIFIEYVRPGSSRDDALLSFVPIIGGSIINHSNMLCNMYNIKEKFAKNDNVALMIVAIRDLETDFLQNRAPRINIVTTRYPRIYDPADARDEREANITGNAIYELMYNSEFGLGIAKENINYFQFKDVGSRINTVLNVENQRILDLINGIAVEDFGIISKVNGKWNYYDESSATVDFTVDSASIIGNIEITYPDSNTAPTKIIADYISYTSGARQVSIGDDNSNVLKISIKHKNNITDVTSYLQYLYQKLNNTLTYKFRMDKVATKFTIGDIIAVSLETPDLNNVPMRIIGLTLNDDFTFDITAETVITASGTSVIFDSAKPVLKSGRPYKISPIEPTPPTPDEEIEQPIVPIGEPNPPPPGEIAPPPPTYRTFTGLNHPYDFNTGTDNLDWYLGNTIDGINADANFDSNGIRTVAFFDPSWNGFVWKNIPSLIYRRLDKTLPTGVLYAIDVGIGVEADLGYVGHTWYGTRTTVTGFRYRSDGFFANQVTNMKYHSGRGWQDSSANWVAYHYNYKAFYRGTKHPDGLDNGAFEYVYTPESDGPRNSHNNIHTFDALARRPSAGAFVFQDFLMRRSGIYRIHFTAVYDANDVGQNFSRLEYIGSTSFYGDGRGVLPQFVESSKTIYNARSSQSWNFSYTTPPSRSIT